MLVVFGGLPGVGKMTIAQQITRTIGPTYLRIATIEQAIHSADVLYRYQTTDERDRSLMILPGLAALVLRASRSCLDFIPIMR